MALTMNTYRASASGKGLKFRCWRMTAERSEKEPEKISLKFTRTNFRDGQGQAVAQGAEPERIGVWSGIRPL